MGVRVWAGGERTIRNALTRVYQKDGATGQEPCEGDISQRKRKKEKPQTKNNRGQTSADVRRVRACARAWCGDDGSGSGDGGGSGGGGGGGGGGCCGGVEGFFKRKTIVKKASSWLAAGVIESNDSSFLSFLFFIFLAATAASKQGPGCLYLFDDPIIYLFFRVQFFIVFILYTFFFFFGGHVVVSVVVPSVEHVSAAPALDFSATTRQARKTKVIVQARCVVGLQKGGEGRGGGASGCVWEGEGGVQTN